MNLLKKFEFIELEMLEVDFTSQEIIEENLDWRRNVSGLESELRLHNTEKLSFKEFCKSFSESKNKIYSVEIVKNDNFKTIENDLDYQNLTKKIDGITNKYIDCFNLKQGQLNIVIQFNKNVVQLVINKRVLVYNDYLEICKQLNSRGIRDDSSSLGLRKDNKFFHFRYIFKINDNTKLQSRKNKYKKTLFKNERELQL